MVTSPPQTSGEDRKKNGDRVVKNSDNMGSQIAIFRGASIALLAVPSNETHGCSHEEIYPLMFLRWNGSVLTPSHHNTRPQGGSSGKQLTF